MDDERLVVGGEVLEEIEEGVAGHPEDIILSRESRDSSSGGTVVGQRDNAHAIRVAELAAGGSEVSLINL